MPNASGNVLGTTSASAAGSTSVSSSCSSRPAQCDALRPSRGGGAVRGRLGAERVEERGELGQRARRPRRAAPARRRGRRATRSAASRSSRSRNAPKPTTTSRASGTRREHERPRREQQVDALGGDQLADEDDDPVARGVERAERRAPPSAAERANDDAGVGARAASGAGASGARRSSSAAQPREAGSGRRRGARGVKRRDVDAGRAEARPVLQPGLVERRPQALGGVARADEHAARAREALARGAAGSAGAA